MLSTQTISKIDLICYKVILDLFCTFSNNKYCGNNFSWNNFNVSATRHCVNEVTKVITRNKKECIEYTEKISKEIVTEVLELSGYK